MFAKWRRSKGFWFAIGGLVLCVSVVVVQIGIVGRRASTKLVCCSNLKRLATSFKLYGSQLEGYPFSNSSQAMIAMVDNGIIVREQTLSPRTSKQLVLRYPLGSPSLIDNRAIVAHEQIDTSIDDVCAVFADGHAECLPTKEFKQAIDTIKETTSTP